MCGDPEAEARVALHSVWPECIFHDPVSREYIDRVGDYFKEYDVLLLDRGRSWPEVGVLRSRAAGLSPVSLRGMTEPWWLRSVVMSGRSSPTL